MSAPARSAPRAATLEAANREIDRLSAQLAAMICDDETARLRADVARLTEELEEMRAVKDDAYAQRNLLVAALSKLFPASLEHHPDEDADWEDEWRWVVFIDLPTGQVSWHIHERERPHFAHLERETGRVWHGHATEEKYRRLEALKGGHAELEEAVGLLETLVLSRAHVARIRGEDLPHVVLQAQDFLASREPKK